MKPMSEMWCWPHELVQPEMLVRTPPTSSMATRAFALSSRSLQTTEERFPVSGRMASGPDGRKSWNAVPRCGFSWWTVQVTAVPSGQEALRALGDHRGLHDKAMNTLLVRR